MMKFDRLYRGTLAAWELLIDFPLPEAVRRSAGRGVNAASKMTGFPLVGVLIGGILALVAQFCSSVFNPVAGGVIFAVLGTMFLDLKDSGRGLGLLTTSVLLRVRGIPAADAVSGASGDWSRIAHPLAGAVAGFLEILKAALLFALAFYSARLWMVVILAGAFTVQGVLAMQPDRESKAPLLEVAPELRNRIWWTLGIVLLILMLFFPFGAIAAAVAIYALAMGFSRWSAREFGGVSPDFITWAGAVAELLLLLIGIFFAIHFK